MEVFVTDNNHATQENTGGVCFVIMASLKHLNLKLIIRKETLKKFLSKLRF